MKEVSCKVIGPVLREAERRRLAPDRLTAGTSCTLAHLRNGKERIHWSEFTQIMRNAREIWSEQELIDIGKRIASSPILLPLTVVGRLLFTAKEFFHYMSRADGGGGLLFTNMRPTCRDTGPGTLEIELLTEEGYDLCREFYLLTLGAYIVTPKLIGLSSASVTMSDVPRGVRYNVAYPSGGAILRKIARALAMPFTARAVARELMAANHVLETRYQEIERARLAAARQATKLRTSNEIGQTVHGELDLDRTLATVTRALVDEAGFTRARVEVTAEIDGIAINRSADHGHEGALSLDVPLTGRGERKIGTLTVTSAAGADAGEREELLSFVVPSVAMAIDNALNYLVLDEYRRGLEVRVAERTAELSRARDDLAGTVHDLERAKEVRDRIFANINHDLRSPLSLILLSVSEARQSGTVSSADDRTLGAIEHGARRVLRMVDELLILAQGREGEVRLWTTVCDLSSMVATVAEAWKPAARAAGLELVDEIEPGSLVQADPNAIERILANLVSNAIKFTPKGGHIRIRVSSAGTNARIEVADDGPGIDAELKSRLFGRFERGSGARSGAINGSGLGLSLVRELAEAHGGSVVADDAPGGGALFRVLLPLTDQAPSSAAARTLELRAADYGVGASADQEARTYEPPEGVTPRARILLAEDDPELRDRTARLLAADYLVYAAPDGAIALEIAKQRSPDLLVTDIAMPNMDGIELTKRFRALPNSRVAPVLVLTTFGGVADRLSGFEAGAVDYIHKPFEPAELRARVRSQLTLRSVALQLLESEKLAALGTLSAGLAHEIRNPANGIINAVGPLRELLPPEAIAPDTPAGQLLDIVEHCSKQVAAMSRQLLGFKRGVEPKRQAVEIASLISRVCTTVTPTLEGVELREELDYKGPIYCAEPLIAQVLTNLVQNGAHAAGRGGWVEVRTGLAEARIVVEVRDSGPGVPDELRERIFEPFFTTKPAGVGTGLGLSTSREIVLRHGGTLDVRNSGGKSVFRVEIPLPS